MAGADDVEPALPVPGTADARPSGDKSLAGDAKAAELDPKDKIGFHLAIGVLLLIAMLSLILVGCIAVNELHHVPADISALEKILSNLSAIEKPTSDDVKRALDIALTIKEMRRAGREFWTSIAQLLLLNILIPVLTSILGYVFGSSRK